MKLRLALFAVVMAAFSQVAMADAPPGAGPMGGMPKIMFRQGGIGTLGSVFDRPSIGIAYLPVDHMMVSAALGLTYNGNGNVVPGMSGPTDKWASTLVLATEYMIHDVYPFAMGPQFAMIATLAPGSAFDMVMLNAAWGFWYAPFNAPVGIGSSLGVTVTLVKNLEPVVSLLTPALRFVYVFN